MYKFTVYFGWKDSGTGTAPGMDKPAYYAKFESVSHWDILYTTREHCLTSPPCENFLLIFNFFNFFFQIRPHAWPQPSHSEPREQFEQNSTTSRDDNVHFRSKTPPREVEKELTMADLNPVLRNSHNQRLECPRFQLHRQPMPCGGVHRPPVG